MDFCAHFTNHYILNLASRADTRFGRAVLCDVLQFIFLIAFQTTHKWEYGEPLEEEMKVTCKTEFLEMAIHIHTSHPLSPLPLSPFALYLWVGSERN